MSAKWEKNIKSGQENKIHPFQMCDRQKENTDE